MKSFRKSTCALTLGRLGLSVSALAISAAGIAVAHGDEVPSVAVHYYASDLLSDAGAAAVYRKISHAARQVCPDGDARDLNRKALATRCQSEAVERAVRQIDSPRLAAKYAAFARQG